MGNTDSPSTELTRHFVRSDFWFLDGNLVIVAGRAVFKVHRGQLERHSDVFNGFFSIPQPPLQETIDNCVYLELPDDPSDVFFFLSALYDGLYFNVPSPDDFPIISGVLRLSNKYFVKHLRERCMIRLHHDWPTSLAGWDRREQEATDAFGRYIPRDVYPHPVLVIQLALDLRIPSILPAAFYDLSRYGPSKIVAGVSPPPSMIFESDHVRVGPLSPAPPEKILTLTRAQFVQLLRGREFSQQYLVNFISESLSSRKPSAECVYRSSGHMLESAGRPCQESFYFITLNILRSIGGISCGRDADTLFTLTQAMDMLTRTDFSDGQKKCGLKMCLPCKIDFATCAARAREEVWDSLPLWFGLSDGAQVVDDSEMVS